MNIQRFSKLVEAYGGSPERWPVHERVAALALLADSKSAQQLQQEALVLDNLLDRLPVLEPSTTLKQRIFHAIENPPDSWQWLVKWLWGTVPRQHILRPALILGLPLLLGLALGLYLLNESHANQFTFEQLAQSEFNALLGSEQKATEWSQWL